MVKGKPGLYLEAWKFGVYISIPIIASVYYSNPDNQRYWADYWQFIKYPENPNTNVKEKIQELIDEKKDNGSSEWHISNSFISWNKLPIDRRSSKKNLKRRLLHHFGSVRVDGLGSRSKNRTEIYLGNSYLCLLLSQYQLKITDFIIKTAHKNEIRFIFFRRPGH